jgi:Ca-activated chloride channel homolog
MTLFCGHRAGHSFGNEKRRMRSSAIGCIGALAIAASVAPAMAADSPTFKSDTRMVAIASTVIDVDHRLVLNLTESDFEVLDNNRAQPLTFFDRALLPIRVLVLLDTSSSMSDSVGLLRDAAREFVGRLRPDDACRVGAFNDTVQFGRTFTSDHDQLSADLADLEPGDSTRLYDALGASLDVLEGGEGRRVILVFTDGADTGSDTTLRTVLRRAREAGVMVYSVGLERSRRHTVDEGLKKLAAETGGGYFELTKTTDLAGTFARIADELHSQYLLGFSPPRLDGRVHDLTIRVKRPGLTVRARRNYLANAESVYLAARKY